MPGQAQRPLYSANPARAGGALFFPIGGFTLPSSSLAFLGRGCGMFPPSPPVEGEAEGSLPYGDGAARLLLPWSSQQTPNVRQRMEKAVGVLGTEGNTRALSHLALVFSWQSKVWSSHWALFPHCQPVTLQHIIPLLGKALLEEYAHAELRCHGSVWLFLLWLLCGSLAADNF